MKNQGNRRKYHAPEARPTSKIIMHTSEINKPIGFMHQSKIFWMVTQLLFGATELLTISLPFPS